MPTYHSGEKQRTLSLLGAHRSNGSPASEVVLTTRRTFAGFKAPERWEFFRQNGYMPVNPFDSLFRTQTITNGKARFTSKPSCGGTTIEITDHFNTVENLDNYAYILLNTSDFAAARAEAIANANQRVIDQRVSLGETFAELGKTRNMIVSTMGTVGRAFRQVKRGQYSAAAQTLGVRKPKGVSRKRSVSGNWLEYQYGWMPLYLTVYGAMTLAYDGMKNRNIILHASGTSATYTSQTFRYNSFPTSHVGTGVGKFWQVPFSYRVNQYRTFRRSCRVVYIYKVTNPNLTTASQLGLTNPTAVAWELVPLSFVVDWFVNVGDCLEQLAAFSGCEFLAGAITYRQRVELTASANLHAPSTTTCYNGMPQSFVSTPTTYRTDVMVKREALVTQPTFGLRLQNGLNMKRFVDGVALLKQRLS